MVERRPIPIFVDAQRIFRMEFLQPMTGPKAASLRAQPITEAIATFIFNATLACHAPNRPIPFLFKLSPEGMRHVSSKPKHDGRKRTTWEHQHEGTLVSAPSEDQAASGLFSEDTLIFILSQGHVHPLGHCNPNGELVTFHPRIPIVDSIWTEQCTVRLPGLNGVSDLAHHMAPCSTAMTSSGSTH